jgi:DNA replication and repair protein RecF
VVIECPNGAGKTSLLEALHFMCYLRSFRVSHNRTLIQEGQDTLFLRALINDQQEEVGLVRDLKVGYAGNNKIVSLDSTAIRSYKELLATYRVMTITDDDMDLIKAGPLVRRIFMDQSLVLHDHEYASILRVFRRVLEQRNSVLATRNFDQQSYDLWTFQLWEKTHLLQARRIEWLETIEVQVNEFLSEFFDPSYAIRIYYCPKKGNFDMTYEMFRKTYATLVREEGMTAHSCFGAHLDDISINFQNRHSRLFASRGQQKLLVVLIKLAYTVSFARAKGTSLVLLDDFLTDFDKKITERLLDLLENKISNCQFLITIPTNLTATLPQCQSLANCHRMRLTGCS